MGAVLTAVLKGETWAVVSADQVIDATQISVSAVLTPSGIGETSLSVVAITELMHRFMEHLVLIYVS